jgi:DNA polymerase III delta subunit
MANVYWLSGNMMQRRPALEEIKQKYIGAEINYLGSDVTYAYAEHCILSTSCFSEQRLFIVSGLPEPATSKQTMMNNLKKLLQNLPSDVVVVFNGIDPSEEQALFKFVGKELDAEVKDFPYVLDKREASGWVSSQFSKYGTAIDADATSMLIEFGGYDPNLKGLGVDQLNLAIRKLVAFTAHRKKVTKDDVVACSYPSEEFVIWRVLDALDSKDFERCQQAFHAMCLEGDGTRDAAEKLVAIAMPRYRMLFFLKEGLAKNLTKKEVTESLSRLRKLSQTGRDYKMRMTVEQSETGAPKQAYSPQYINNTLEGFYGNQPLIEKYTRKDLYRIMGSLQDVALEIRSRNNDAGIALVIDSFLLTVCNKAEEEHMKTVRRSYEP